MVVPNRKFCLTLLYILIELAPTRCLTRIPLYIIGTEVPTPGGALAEEERITFTIVGSVLLPLDITSGLLFFYDTSGRDYRGLWFHW